MISAIKLFYLNGTAMVAVYGGDREGADDWQCNLPVEEVIDGDPSCLPAEQAVPITAASQMVTFTPQFRQRLQPHKPVMRFPELVELISTTTDNPTEDVHKIVLALLEQLAKLVETGGQLDTPRLKVRPPEQLWSMLLPSHAES